MLEFGAVGWLIVGTIVLVAIVLLIVLIARRRKRRLNDERPRNARERRLTEEIERLKGELASARATIAEQDHKLVDLGQRLALRILVMMLSHFIPKEGPYFTRFLEIVGSTKTFHIERDHERLLAEYGRFVPPDSPAMRLVLGWFEELMRLVRKRDEGGLPAAVEEVRSIEEQDLTSRPRAPRRDAGFPDDNTLPARHQGWPAPTTDTMQMPVRPAPGYREDVPPGRPVAAAPASPAAWPPDPRTPQHLTPPPAASGADDVLAGLRREERGDNRRRGPGGRRRQERPPVDLGGRHPDAAATLARLDPLGEQAAQTPVQFNTITLRLHFSQGAPYLMSSWETTEAFKARGGVPAGDELRGEDLEYAQQQFATFGRVIRVEVIRA